MNMSSLLVSLQDSSVLIAIVTAIMSSIGTTLTMRGKIREDLALVQEMFREDTVKEIRKNEQSDRDQFRRDMMVELTDLRSRVVQLMAQVVECERDKLVLTRSIGDNTLQIAQLRIMVAQLEPYKPKDIP